jgi:hypothetical protein
VGVYPWKRKTRGRVRTTKRVRGRGGGKDDGGNIGVTSQMRLILLDIMIR